MDFFQSEDFARWQAARLERRAQEQKEKEEERRQREEERKQREEEKRQREEEKMMMKREKEATILRKRLAQIESHGLVEAYELVVERAPLANQATITSKYSVPPPALPPPNPVRNQTQDGPAILAAPLAQNEED